MMLCMSSEIKNDVLKSGILDFEVFPVDDKAFGLVEGLAEGKILVMIGYTDRPTEEPFLHKILGAVKLNPEKDVVKWSVMPGQKLSLTPISAGQRGGKILMFGLEPKALGMNLAQMTYTVQQIGPMEVLLADSLKAIAADPAKKRQLWAALQQMFPASK